MHGRRLRPCPSPCYPATCGISCARSYRTLRDGSTRHFVPGYDQPVPLGQKDKSHSPIEGHPINLALTGFTWVVLKREYALKAGQVLAPYIEPNAVRRNGVRPNGAKIRLRLICSERAVGHNPRAEAFVLCPAGATELSPGFQPWESSPKATRPHKALLVAPFGKTPGPPGWRC